MNTSSLLMAFAAGNPALRLPCYTRVMAGFIDILRSGAWLTRERVRLIALALVAAAAIGAVFLVASSDGRNDRFGRPLGTDFSNVYAAGTYVLEGQPAAPFDPARQYVREQAIFGTATPFYGWHYPPFFLGLAALLALMPYGLALLVWQGVTLGIYVLSIRSIVSAGALRSDRLWPLLVLAFPAVFINLGQAHNGFLTAALIGAALAQLDRRPWLAGILLGLLAYKPQFGLLIPLVLIASGRWRVFAAAAVTVALLALAVTLAFGAEVWSAFLASTKFTRLVVLEQGGTGWFKIQSVFSWVRMWGGGITLAYAMQGMVTMAIAAALIWLWRSAAAFALKAALLIIGCLLGTPYSLDYDLMLLAPAIAFIAADGAARGFGAFEKTMLAMLWIVPLIARSVPQATLIPLAVPIMLLAFGILLRRAMNETGCSPNLWRFAARGVK
jgi:alpha-1,2-mannosyltransferase